MQYETLLRETTKKIVRARFRNDNGEPFELTDRQADIVNCILYRKYHRVQIIASTQYGKSDSVAIGLILRSESHKENWAIISGQKDKAQIIMGRVIQHSFDNEYYYKRLELDANMPLDRLRRERSKDNITWIGGGGIKTFTANSSNKNRIKESLTGFGSANIVEDEASLVPNSIQSMILRMLGGHADNFLLKIGNPFYRNHFLKTWESDKYHKIFIDYKIALSEGRYTEEFIEEMRGESFFDILYECKFPEKDRITPEGYMQLFTEDLLNDAYISEEEAQELFVGEPRIGADFAGAGNDRSAYVIRYPKVMMLLETNKIKDTMQQIPILEDYIKKYGVVAEDVGIDYGGLGQGIGDRMHERDIYTNNIMFGESSPEKDKYKNMRAFMYYEMYKWLKGGGKIVKNEKWLELTLVNYKQDSERRLQIQPKEDLKKLAKEMALDISSPDVADAGALTFADNSDIVTENDFEIV